MTSTFESKEWDHAISQHARKSYIKHQVKRTVVTLSVCILAIGIGVQSLSPEPQQFVGSELDDLVDAQVVAVYEAVVPFEEDLLNWEF
jgi:hypothetical protein